MIKTRRIIIVSDLSHVQAEVSDDSSINIIKGGITNKTEHAPSQFPETVKDENSGPRIPIIYLNKFLENTNETVINEIKRVIETYKKYELPTKATVILNENDTSRLDVHDKNGNSDINSYVKIVPLKKRQAPSQFPEIVENKNSGQGLPVIYLNKFLENINQTVINEIIKNYKKYELPTEATVILNNSNTAHLDIHNKSGNSDINSYIRIVPSNEQKEENPRLKNKRSTIILLVSVLLISIFFYVLLVLLRAGLE